MGRLQSGWFVLVAILAAAFGLSLAHSWAWMFLGVVGAAAFLKSSLKEVVDPDRAVHMRFGRYVDSLNSGWHVTIPGFDVCCVISGRPHKFHVDISKEFTAEKTEVSADVLVTVQLCQDNNAIRNAALELPVEIEEIRDLFKHIVHAKVRAAIGGKKFSSLISNRAGIERDAKARLDGELEKYGHRAVEIEVYNLNETVQSEAARIRKITAAEADGIKASAEALKDNWQAAGVAMAGEVAKAVATWASGSSKELEKKPEGRAQKQPQINSQTLAENVAGAVRIFRKED